jgi:hypothetical protein
MPLDDAEHPDPRFCLRTLSGKGRGTGIAACDRRSLAPVHRNHVVGESLITACFSDGRDQWKVLHAKNVASPRPSRIGTTIGGTIQRPVMLLPPQEQRRRPTMSASNRRRSA